ncbi:MAG: von Willebrand factor type A domain-containing protein, partial [Planctomycetota bacterium]|nr:von Willebrand factor type A domain-containing protein [Planctomycetota bacterium]
MTNHPFIDDPRLSAYALGEMSAIEAAAFANEIADCPEALAEVAEIKTCVENLTKAFAVETVPAYRPIKVAEMASTTPDQSPPRTSRRRTILLLAFSSAAMLFIGFIVSTFSSNEAIVGEYYASGTTVRPTSSEDQNQQSGLAASVQLTERERRALAHLSYAGNQAEANNEGDAHAASSTEMSLTSRIEHLTDADQLLRQREKESKVTTFESLTQRKRTLASLGYAGKSNTANENGGSNGKMIADEYLNGVSSLERNIRSSRLDQSGLGGGKHTFQRKPSKNDAIQEELPRLMVEKKESLSEYGGKGKKTPEDDVLSTQLSKHDKAQPFSRLKTDSQKSGDEAKQQLAESDHWGLDVRYQKGADSIHPKHARELARNESYAPLIENNFLAPRNHPLSTFGLDVDTASYSNTRRFLQQNTLPPPDAVRIEELVNYFSYSDPQPTEHPLNVSVAYAACPWAPQHKLVRIGLKGKEIVKSKRPISNLVFLIDVSGSMQDANKLPLVQVALQMLAEELGEKDHISIVTYSNEAKLLLPPTSGHQRSEILSAITQLKADGSTNGAAGIQLAYETAALNLLKEGSNRVILCTDGDFNVGITDDDQLVTFLKEQTSAGIFLSIFGFGMGNLKDAKLEKLADRGNGHYGYIDSTHEARKVFVEELTSTLYTIAKDVKLQVEFNPSRVSEYRLIGYENRLMPAQDFNDDTKDGGDMGAGHSVVAMYEIVPTGIVRQPPVVDDLKYQTVPKNE